jgi:hypothetical protein
MRGTHDFVVLPARPVTVLPAPVFIGHHPVITGESVYFFLEKQQAIQEMTHNIYLCFRVLFIVPTLCVGMPPETLCVSHRWSGAGFVPRGASLPLS